MRHLLTHLLAVTAVVSGSPFRLLDAQSRGHIDAGSGTMRLGSETPFGVVRVAPSFQLNSSRFAFAGEADFAGHTEHGWQTNGHLRAAVRQRFSGSVEAHLGVEGGLSRTRWGRGAGGWLGGGRLQVGSDLRGFALGLGSGHTFTSGGSQPLSRIEAGGWGRVGRVDIGVWLKRTGLKVPGSDPSSDGNPADTIRLGEESTRRTLQDHYTDVEATIGWTRGNLALEAGAGRRFGKAFQFTSWHVRALYQVTSRVALIASSGQFPVDVVSGLPSGGFTTFSMRFNLRNDPPTSSTGELARSRAKWQAFSATAAGDGNHLILVRVPGANAVEMMGDFTDWSPVLLVPDGPDMWRLRMRIPAGLHEINMRVDGGPWMVPAGLTAVDDGLGGRVGIFSLE
jgi:hypothetical protein